MRKSEIQKHYQSKHDSYVRLAENLKQALITFLSENQVSYHSISFRIKEFDSYLEKIERKGYKNPIDQIEDCCGIRIICFYPLDLDKISRIIHKEFEVLQSVDKSSQLEPDRFGYRSNHYIVKIWKEWAKAPNYRGLENLKAEVQVRTILMHSRAEKKEEIPSEFRRKLYQLSALLEIADNQFQDLKNEKENFKQLLIIESKGKQSFDFTKDLNLDTLQAYLDFVFPQRKKLNEATSRSLLEELTEHDISLKELDKMRLELEPIISEVEKEISKSGWAQVGVVRAILDLKSDKYWASRETDGVEDKWEKTITTHSLRYFRQTKKHMKYFLLIIAALTLFGCVLQTGNNGEKTFGVISSAHYKPLNPGEDESLKKADKSILPDDVRNNFKGTEKKSVIWTGIVDTVIYSKPADTVMLVDVYLQHRYYDFIEDFSVQQEKMFVSPFGEGNYVFRQAIVGKRPFEEIKTGLQKSIFKECLIFSYGVVTSLQDSTPYLEAENIRIVFPENYATNIFSYKAERDKNHKLVLSADGQPNLIDFQRLIVPNPGRNQLGSRLKNSKD